MQSVSVPSHGPTLRQRSLRHRLRSLPLAGAVHLAAEAFFRFRYRAVRADALWSETEHVWLGSETFLHWAMWDAAIDIPWVVAAAADAPPDGDELRKAVRAELKAYWTEQVAGLPRKKSPGWLPLP
ncbi:MAG: hypothetical protein HUU20_04100 [Pirellulales bacterium]|nr:hypothetical protein [Pirellulales bacterium]